MLFFFYGSLLRGASNHGVIAGRMRFMGEDAVAGTLHDLGDYPGARPGTGGLIHGELFEALDESVRALLDEFEGEEYPRVTIRTLGGQDAWIYTRHDEGPVVDGGDWRAHRRALGRPA